MNNQYPKTLSDAVDALSNHPFDQGYYDRKKKRKEEAKKRGQKDKEEKETSFKQTGSKFCYCCGDPGRLSPKCPKKDTTPREEWVVNWSMQNFTGGDGEKGQKTMMKTMEMSLAGADFNTTTTKCIVARST